MSKAEIAQAFKIAEQKGFKLLKASDLKPFQFIRCGIPQFDELGGPVLGRFVVRYGNPGAGKSTLSARYMAWAQKEWPDKIPLLVDAELKVAPEWYETQGVDTSNLLLLQNCGTMEDYFDAILALVKSGVVSYCVIDSISAMTPRDLLENSKGIEKSVSDNQVAADAKKIQQFIKMAKEEFFKANTACEIIAQVRTGGIGSTYTYETFSGGHMLRHMAVQIWHGERVGSSDSKETEEVTVDGNKVKLLKAFTTKWTLDKDTGPNETRRAFVKFVVGVGFDDFECHLRGGIRLGTIMESSKGRYVWPDLNGEERKLHGFDKLSEYFKANTDQLEELKKRNLAAVYEQQPEEATDA